MIAKNETGGQEKARAEGLAFAVSRSRAGMDDFESRAKIKKGDEETSPTKVSSI